MCYLFIRRNVSVLHIVRIISTTIYSCDYVVFCSLRRKQILAAPQTKATACSAVYTVAATAAADTIVVAVVVSAIAVSGVVLAFAAAVVVVVVVVVTAAATATADKADKSECIVEKKTL